MDNGRCQVCGANLALVGRVHRCVPRAGEFPVDYSPVTRAELTAPDPVCDALMAQSKRVSGTYRYRDPDKRRVQMRDVMRKRRAKKA